MVIYAFFGLLLNVKTLNQVCKEITEEPALSPENGLSYVLLTLSLFQTHMRNYNMLMSYRHVI